MIFLLNFTKFHILVPRQTSSAAPKPQPVPSVDIQIKLQTSITDKHNYFSDDSDDEELWTKATQIEEKLSKMYSKNSPELSQISYAEFQDAEGPTSTQQEPITSQMDVAASQKIRVLQNRCSALEKQLKRSLPNIAKAQAQASQANCEVSDLKIKIKKLKSENEELRKKKLNEADKISGAAAKLRHENEMLRRQLMELEKKMKEPQGECMEVAIVKGEWRFFDKSEKKSSQVHQFSLISDIKPPTELVYDETIHKQYHLLHSKAASFNQISFLASKSTSKLNKFVTSLQLKIANKQNNLTSIQPENFQKFSNNRLHIDITDDFSFFNQVATIISAIAEDIKSTALRQIDEHFVTQEFAFKQAQYCSDQYFGDKRNQLRIKDLSSDVNELTKAEKLFTDEINIESRRLLGMISILAENSKNLSELILTQNLSMEPDQYVTVVDLICDMIDPSILQSRLLYHNSGMTLAFAELLKNLTIHYESYPDQDWANEKLEKFFSHLLAMSTSSPKVLLRFSEFLISILSHKNGKKLLKKLCKNFPSSNLEYSNMYKIYQIPRCGCLLQIFFVLLTTAFRFIEKVNEENLEVLLDLTMSLNTLVYLLVADACDLDFLKPESYESGELKNHCKCYFFLVISLIILVNQTLRHRNVDNEECEYFFVL